jgi:hypothetical protein
MEKRKLSKQDEHYNNIIIDYYNFRVRQEKELKHAEELKQKFYSEMDQYFVDKVENEKIVNTIYLDKNEKDEYVKTPKNILVKKIQRVKLKFNVKKLKSKLGKEISKKVIKKSYSITDMESLIKYLKSCNVDPEIFKSFISVQETVNENKLDELEIRGKISKDQIKGCYSIEAGQPYYTIRKVTEKDENGEWR